MIEKTPLPDKFQFMSRSDWGDNFSSSLYDTEAEAFSAAVFNSKIATACTFYIHRIQRWEVSGVEETRSVVGEVYAKGN